MNMNPNPLSTVYATKRRRRSNKSLRPAPKEPPGSQAKSNPSKRHRERLNGELDHLASLLPFEQNILSKLDRLSILRLAVAFLRTKTYFHVAMNKEKEELHDLHYRRDFLTYDNQLLDGEIFLQALQGFLMILDCNGELFFATHTIEHFLGFHQSDVIHTTIYELVHSEDRAELQRQLMWSSLLGPDEAGLTLQDLLQPENSHLLERSFTVRFRCLLDNTSGFLRLDIRGRIRVVHGQNKKSDEPPLALFCLCTPFGPPSLTEMPNKEVAFKSKHKLDLSFVSLDARGKELLQYNDSEIAELGGYDLVHYDDLSYVASAHQELLKTGQCGMIAYRLMTKEMKWQWLQTSSKLIYRNSKMDFIQSIHRPLIDEEGRDLLGKRTMDFKVTFLDGGHSSSYLSDGDLGLSIGNTTNTNGSATPNASGSGNTISSATKLPKRYKSQYRESRGGSKRKSHNNNNNNANSSASSSTPSAAAAAAAAAAVAAADLYGDSAAAAAAAAANPAAAAIASSPYGALYGAQGSSALSHPYAASAEASIYLQQQNLSAASHYQSIYSPVENRYFSPEYLASYTRSLGYYPDYAASAAHAQYLNNSYFDVSSRPIYDSQLRYIEDKGNECKYPFGEGGVTGTPAVAAVIGTGGGKGSDPSSPDVVGGLPPPQHQHQLLSSHHHSPHQNKHNKQANNHNHHQHHYPNHHDHLLELDNKRVKCEPLAVSYDYVNIHHREDTAW